ncbi:MAG: hypothetical protein DRN20_06805 [Thermoplasmata archaeon]|nr:MAG: hypothetical protein DRN20_06805 [Thermoplasmata archaeon]
MERHVNERVTVRIDAKLLQLIDQFIMESDDISNRSEFIRKASIEYLSRHGMAISEGERVCIDLGRDMLENVEVLSRFLNVARENVCKMLISLGFSAYPVSGIVENMKSLMSTRSAAEHRKIAEKLGELLRK